MQIAEWLHIQDMHLFCQYYPLQGFLGKKVTFQLAFISLAQLRSEAKLNLTSLLFGPNLEKYMLNFFLSVKFGWSKYSF